MDFQQRSQESMGIIQATVCVKWLSEMPKSPSGNRKEWPKHSLWSCHKKKGSCRDTFKGTVYPLRFPAGCLGAVHCTLTSCNMGPRAGIKYVMGSGRRRKMRHSCSRKDSSFHTQFSTLFPVSFCTCCRSWNSCGSCGTWTSWFSSSVFWQRSISLSTTLINYLTFFDLCFLLLIASAQLRPYMWPHQTCFEVDVHL